MTCPHCAKDLPASAHTCDGCGNVVSVHGGYQIDRVAALKAIGGVLFAAGALAVGYYLLFFETTVRIGSMHVHNMALADERQTGLIAGGLATIVGLALFIHAERAPKT